MDAEEKAFTLGMAMETGLQGKAAVTRRCSKDEDAARKLAWRKRRHLIVPRSSRQVVAVRILAIFFVIAVPALVVIAFTISCNSGREGERGRSIIYGSRFCQERHASFLQFIQSLLPSQPPSITTTACGTPPAGTRTRTHQTASITTTTSSMLGAILPAGLLALASLPTPSSATLLYVASYAGTITTLNLTVSGNGAPAAAPAAGAEIDLCGTEGAGIVAPRKEATVAVMETVSKVEGLGSPAWLTLDHESSMLYCMDEGLTKSYGSVSSFSTGPDGILEKVSTLNTLQGPVSAVAFGAGRMAVAHYARSMINVLNISDPAAMSPVQNETFIMSGPGPVKYRQDAPHPHQAVTDPTGKYILVPDLGADLLRIFSVSKDGLSLSVREPLKVAAGSGPRHVSFAEAGDKTFMYLVSELANTVTGFEIKYANDGLSFTELFKIPTHGEGEEVPTTAAAAELLVSVRTLFLCYPYLFVVTKVQIIKQPQKLAR